MTAFRPLVQHGRAPRDAVPLAGGPLWFTEAERLDRNRPPEIIPSTEIDPPTLDRLTAPRAPLLTLDLAQPQIMGIVNVTPDSFSDAGRHFDPETAIAAGLAMAAAGAAILDIGGESTRPGARTIPADEEIARILPVIAGIRAASPIPISVDTRKAAVARAAVQAGANLVNDVSGFTFDPALAPFCAANALPVCVMHAQGDPATMQQDPHYDDVLLDVLGFLDTRLHALEALNIPRARILIDPGIGFGKTLGHNLTLLRNIAAFHALGAPILLGVSRKRFIGTLTGEPEPDRRFPGSVAAGLAALAQAVQILRVHDVQQTVQAVRIWQAVRQA